MIAKSAPEQQPHSAGSPAPDKTDAGAPAPVGSPEKSRTLWRAIGRGLAGTPLGATLFHSRASLKARNDAMEHRDKMRDQRDDARRQRDALKTRVESLEARVKRAEGASPRSEQDVEATLLKMQATLDKLSAGLGYPPEKRAAPAVDMSPAAIQARLFSHANFHRLEQQRAARAPEVRAKLAAGVRLSTTEQEVLVERHTPLMHKRLVERRPPPPGVAFLTVANGRFLPGLEGLLLSLLDVYPELQSDIFVYHDGSLSAFVQARLRSIYPNLRFETPDMAWLELVASNTDNHKRIGKLGYMNLEAFTHEGYDRMIALDSDLLVVDDISPLWEEGDDDFRLCYDCGDREYVAMSNYTGEYIVNSGVISIPKRYLNQETFEEIKAIAAKSMLPLNDLIDRFADQKTWNMFLADKPKRILDTNYNCNIKYIVRHLGGNTEGVSVIHFAGPKPWNTTHYLHDDMITDHKSKSVAFPKIWSDRYRQLLYRRRLGDFRDDARRRRRTPVLPGAAEGGRPCVMIGNGPSIGETPIEKLKAFETFCFNWFVLHERFDAVRPQHLILASHMFFGGWNTQEPAFPPSYLSRLTELKHRPAIWTSFYFKPLIEELKLEQSFEVNYLMFEKPFKRFVDGLGSTHCDIEGYLDDARTGVLSFGAPIAAALGFKRVVLVGCDSNYNTAPGRSNYFYDEVLHTSLSTRGDSLTATWTDGGAGHFAYEVVRQALARRGVELLDATVGGSLDLPKTTVEALLDEFGGAHEETAGTGAAVVRLYGRAS